MRIIILGQRCNGGRQMQPDRRYLSCLLSNETRAIAAQSVSQCCQGIGRLSQLSLTWLNDCAMRVHIVRSGHVLLAYINPLLCCADSIHANICEP